MDRFQSNGLGYYCNQKVSNMTDSKGNLFYESCSKNLVDFRGKTKSEFDEIVSKSTDVCGVFYSSQIGDEVEIKLNWKKPFFILSFVGTLLFSRKVQAQQVDSPKTEVKDSTYHISSKAEESKSEEKPQQNPKLNKCKSKSHLYPYNRSKIFISKRFPFIHIRRKLSEVVGKWR